MQDLFRNATNIQGGHIGDDLLGLLRRYVVGVEAELQKAGNLLFQAQLLVAGMGHVAAHHAGGTDLQQIKILGGPVGHVVAENLLQFLCGFPLDQLYNGGLGVGFNVDLPEVFIELRKGQLDSGFYRIDVYRGQLRGGGTGGAELIGEHKLHQLCKNAVLGTENILKAAVGNAAFPQNLTHCGFLVAFFQKQPDTDL